MTPRNSSPYAIATYVHKDQDNMSKQILRIALIALALVLARNVSSAQLYSEDAAIAQALFSKTKKILVSNYLDIDDTPQNAAFWKLYDTYEAKRKAIYQERFFLFKEYSDKYLTLDDATATKLVAGFMENTEKVDKLNQQYFRKFKKLVGGLQAATLFQIEVYTQTALQNDAHMQIPIIGELQRIEQNKITSRF